MRSYGGFGGPSGPTPELHQLPNRAPDLAGVHHLNRHTCRMSPPLKTLAVVKGVHVGGGQDAADYTDFTLDDVDL